MIHGETYLLCNMGLCACAYPLGGRLAGLPLPRPSRWMLAAALGVTPAVIRQRLRRARTRLRQKMEEDGYEF